MTIPREILLCLICTQTYIRVQMILINKFRPKIIKESITKKI